MLIDFGYSPCPNDTFMFWAWANERLTSDIKLQPRLKDIQELNQIALSSSPLPLTKLSAGAYLNPRIKEQYQLLKVGAALGRGCGPLVISTKPWSATKASPPVLAVPGFDTTAYRLAHLAMQSNVKKWVQLRYDQIMPAILAGEVDAGVIIHESRFTYQKLGLKLALDLGKWWEDLTNLPLPLGVMVAHKSLDQSTLSIVEETLRKSIVTAWALLKGDTKSAEAEELWRYLKRHAIELEDSTIRDHIELYVNDYSLDLTSEGEKAIERLALLSAKT